MSKLVATGLRRSFAGRPPVAALRSVDLTVEAGTIVAVLGPSGCGKTTLLRTLAGMERPDEGTITLAGRMLDGPRTHVAPDKRAIGLVPQEGALFPHLDVAHNIGFGLSRRDRGERISEMLEMVGLHNMGRRRPHQLSGGQQQRVALARALAPSPEVVLLDEPFSALDTGLRAALRAEVAQTLHIAGTTAVLVTHDQIEAMTMSDVLAVMRNGRIVQTGRPADVYRRPVDEWTARFLGDAVITSGRRVGDATVQTPLGELTLAPAFAHHDGRDVAVFCRPEQICPVAISEAGVDAKVVAVQFLGPDAMVTLEIDDLTVSARWPSSRIVEVGDVARVNVTGHVLAYPPTGDASTAATNSEGDSDDRVRTNGSSPDAPFSSPPSMR